MYIMPMHAAPKKLYIVAEYMIQVAKVAEAAGGVGSLGIWSGGLRRATGVSGLAVGCFPLPLALVRSMASFVAQCASVGELTVGC